MVNEFLGRKPQEISGMMTTLLNHGDARCEPDRSNEPVILLTLDDLASLVVTYYESFDLNGRALIPLVRVYWVAE